MKVLVQIASLLVFFAVVSSQTQDGVWIYEKISDPICFYNNNFNWLYIRVFLSSGLIDPNAQGNLNKTKNIGLNRRLYINPTMKIGPKETLDAICNKVIKGLNEKFHLYISIYADFKFWSKDITKNREYIEKLQHFMGTQPECYKTLNIISRKKDWESVFGANYLAFSNRVLIWDKTGAKTCDQSGFEPFGGWRRADGIIYLHDKKVCDNKCDVSCLFMGKKVKDM